MKPKAEIMARLRKERAKDGLKEVRSIIAPVKYHAEIKANAAKYLAKLVKRDDQRLSFSTVRIAPSPSMPKVSADSVSMSSDG